MPPRDEVTWSGLEPEPKILNERAIVLHFRALQVSKETLALANHLQEPLPSVVVFGVGGEVSSQMSDSLRQQCNLHTRRTGIVFVGPVLVDRRCLFERHRRMILGATGTCAYRSRAIVGSMDIYFTPPLL